MGRWAVGLVFLIWVLLLSVPKSDAASLAMKRGTSSGTLVHDGSGNAGTSDFGADGDTSTWAQLGYASAADLLVIGGYPLETFDDGTPPLFPTAPLTGLRVIATVPIDTVPCPACSTIDDAGFGTFLPTTGAIRNVAWFAQAMIPLTLQPGALPIQMQAGVQYLFGLSTPDIMALDSVISQYGPANVRIALSAAIPWPTGGTFTPGLVSFETTTVPEPASMTLFAVGVASMLAARRRRRSNTRV